MRSVTTDRYQAAELLGKGGMGAVYRAHDTVRGHPVALKRLLIEPDTQHREERIALFHREYRTLVELKHPCVIKVFDYGVDDESPYYTMELLDGADLSRKAPLPWRVACSLARDVCSSLALLHSRGYVHRDVSPLNVRCTDDGRAKLIDFGAMVPMGISTLTMGTPPCVAPEALSRQPLDGRTDLFALGATLYFTLTGRHAFSARNLAQLGALHQRVPRRPAALVPDLPAALERLVLSLLSIDPMARPRHAAEVMERLTILAELAPLEQMAVHQSYLNTPALVGRELAGKEIVASLRKTLAGKGSVLRLLAAEGGGRSRMLQVSVMDARLAGMRVLRAGCSDAAAGAYGVVRALLTEVRAGADPARELLGRRPVLQELLNNEAVAPDDLRLRERILMELSALCLDLSRAQALLIAVDDIERCDEPSLAALSTLASRARRAPIQLLFSDSGASSGEAPGALALLRELSHEIALAPLDEERTEALLGSVFGQVPNLATVARYVFERAVGNPRATMELAQALVEHDLARYELGSWSLPGQLAVDALPASLRDVRRAKFAVLGPDARELAQVLSIVDGYAIQFGELCALTEHGDAARLSEAHAALLSARVVEPSAAQVLADRSWLEIVRQSTEQTQRRRIYLRLAEVFSTRGEKPIAIVHCLMRAGDETRALDLLCGSLAHGSLVDDGDYDYPELLLEADACCERLLRLPRERFFVQRELVALADRAIVKGLGACFQRVLRQLCSDSGLDDWHKLAGQVPEDVRLTQALTAVQARYDASDETQRVLSPLDAVKGLVETVYRAAVYASMIGDRGLADSLPPLQPFEPLSPAIAAVNMLLDAQRALIGARYEDALDLFLARLDGFNKGVNMTGLSDAQLSRSRMLLHYTVGALQAGLGIKGALDQAERLESLPQGQILAASVRENYCVRRGNTRAAQQWRRRLELLQIQQRRPHALKVRQATQQLECSSHADDLEETKRNLELLEELSEIYPSALPYVHFGRAEYERIRGDYAAGVRHVRVALEIGQAGMHSVWPWAAGCEIDCLRLLKQLEAAREVGLRHVAEARRVGLRVMGDHIETFLALVEAELGLFDSAIERLDRGIEYREFYGMHGLNLGWSYESRAHVALAMKDREVFERCMRSCAEHYHGGRDNPALAARYERLMQAAAVTWQGIEEIELAAEESLSTVAQSSVLMPDHATLLHTLISCGDRDERARIVLQRLLMTANCQDGQLYLLREEGLTLAAGSSSPAPAMRALAERLLGLHDEAVEEHTITGEDEDSLLNTTLAAGEFKPVLLTCARGNEVAMVGVVALSFARADGGHHFSATARELSSALIDLGDVRPKFA